MEVNLILFVEASLKKQSHKLSEPDCDLDYKTFTKIRIDLNTECNHINLVNRAVILITKPLLRSGSI